MILGIGFNRIYPEVIQTLPSGLQILKSKFLPAVEGEVCCIGGPLGAVNSMVNSIGALPTMNYFTNLMSKFNNYKSKVDFFPSTYLKSHDLFDEIVDKDIPYIKEYQSMISEDDEDEDIDSLLRGEDLVKNI